MNCLQRLVTMLFNTKTAKALDVEAQGLRERLVSAQAEEKVAREELAGSMTEAQAQAKAAAKYRPSSLAEGFGWKAYG